MKKLLTILLLFIGITVNATNYYLATTSSTPAGNDANAGTISAPWATWQKAINNAHAGDTVFVRGGIWYPTGSTSVGIFETYSGTQNSPICFFNYPDETPIIDGRDRNLTDGWNSCFSLTARDFIKFRGITIRNFRQPQTSPYNAAAGVGGTNNSNLTFENMTVHNIGGCAFKLFGAWKYPASGFTFPESGFDTAAYLSAGRANGYLIASHATLTGDTTRFINCDAYNLCDSVSAAVGPGGSADGWKLDNEVNSVFILSGCRAWNCSDDGFDASGTTKVLYDNCWSMGNGFLGASPTTGGDGTGIKDAYPRAYIAAPLRIERNVITAFNRGPGFAAIVADDYPCLSTVYLNTVAFRNDRGIVTSFGYGCDSVQPMVLRNNIRYESREILGYDAYSFKSGTTEDHNSWNGSIVLTNADFITIDSTTIWTQLSGARKSDHSLPDISVFKLAEGSDLIGAGVDVGMSSIPNIGIDWEWLGAGSPEEPPVNPTSNKGLIMINHKPTKSIRGNLLYYNK